MAEITEKKPTTCSQDLLSCGNGEGMLLTGTYEFSILFRYFSSLRCYKDTLGSLRCVHLHVLLSVTPFVGYTAVVM